MQPDREKRKVLLNFLDRKLFDPVLEALPEQYSSERDRRMLEDVKKSIVFEKARFHIGNLSARNIRESYFRELYYETNGRYGRELEDLELPRLIQLRDQFEMLCNKLDLTSKC